MFKWFKYISKGIAIINVLAVEIPRVIEDGQISVQEMANIVTAICLAGGWKVNVKVPKDISEALIEVR